MTDRKDISGPEALVRPRRAVALMVPLHDRPMSTGTPSVTESEVAG
jgi:hypothetical protein